LGLGLGIPLLAALGLVLFLSLGHRKRSYPGFELDATQDLTAGGHGVHSWSPQWSKHSAAGELSTEITHVSEVPDSQQPFELQTPDVKG
jgi:hypothetical protein